MPTGCGCLRAPLERSYSDVKGLKFAARFGLVDNEEDLDQDSDGYEFLDKFGVEEVKKIYLKVAETGTSVDVHCPETFEEGVRIPNLIDEFVEGFKEKVGRRLGYVDIAAWAFHYFTFNQPLKNCNHRTGLEIMKIVLLAFRKKLAIESNEELLGVFEDFEKKHTPASEIREWLSQNLSAI
jgi:hypothetical protein